MKTFRIEDIFQPGTFGLFDATTGEKIKHEHTLDMFASSANVANKSTDTKADTKNKNKAK